MPMLSKAIGKLHTIMELGIKKISKRFNKSGMGMSIGIQLNRYCIIQTGKQVQAY